MKSSLKFNTFDLLVLKVKNLHFFEDIIHRHADHSLSDSFLIILFLILQTCILVKAFWFDLKNELVDFLRPDFSQLLMNQLYFWLLGQIIIHRILERFLKEIKRISDSLQQKASCFHKYPRRGALPTSWSIYWGFLII